MNAYATFANQTALIIGRNTEIVWLIEPDFLQYAVEKSGQFTQRPLTHADMRLLFDDFVTAIKTHLPNALISWDISPWVDMAKWWGFFKNSKYVDFINTSGGGHLANNNKIDPFNPITYEFMKKLTGRKIISDSGMGF